MRKMDQYSDEVLMKMEYDAMKKERDTYRIERDSWRHNFEELKIKYEELQNIFVETDDELNYYRDKFVDESLQHNYLKNDMEEVKARISVLEARIRDTYR
jgi:hypothetical protein